MLQLAWPWCAAAVLLPLLATALPPVAPRGSEALLVPFFREARHWGGNTDLRPRRWPVWLAVLAWGLWAKLGDGRIRRRRWLMVR